MYLKTKKFLSDFVMMIKADVRGLRHEDANEDKLFGSLD